MIPVSNKWAPAITANHTPVYRVEVWRTGSRLITDLRIVGGSVDKSAGRYPRTTASIEVADLSPSTVQLLTPFGNRLRIYRGLRYFDNTTEMLLLADLDIIQSRLVRPDGALSIECADPSALISAQPTPGPTRGANISDVGDAIRWVLARSKYYGTHTPTFTPAELASRGVRPDWSIDGDPWDACEQLIAGSEIFFTPARVPVVQARPQLKTTADANLYALAGGTVTVIDSALSRAPNVVYVNGAADDTGKFRRGSAVDSNVNSPTYYAGAYGQVVEVIDAPTPLTQAQAAADAAAYLYRLAGKVRTVELDALPNPALEPGDTVQIRFAGGALERHVLQAVSIPLGPQDMHVATRTTAYTTTGWP